jgi:exosortase H (IPTLxxWG-CTERM-specific)
MVWFVVLFVVYMIVGVVLLDLAFIKEWLIEPWTRFNATAAAAFAGWIGIDTTASGTSVRLATTELEVADDCNGVQAVLILLASVLAFPASWRRKIIGIGVGTVSVLGCNIIRLVNLIAVARYWPSRLELFHIYIWQTLIVLIALALFLVWGTYFAGSRASDTASTST